MGDYHIESADELYHHLVLLGGDMRAVLLDADNQPFQVKAFPKLEPLDSEGNPKDVDIMIATTLDSDERGTPMLFAANVFEPKDGLRLPVFPVSILANR